MVTIKNTGERQYQGLDSGQDPARLVVIRPGDEREVSDEHAANMLKNWPESFKKAGAASKAADAKGGAS